MPRVLLLACHVPRVVLVLLISKDSAGTNWSFFESVTTRGLDWKAIGQLRPKGSLQNWKGAWKSLSSIMNLRVLDLEKGSVLRTS